MFSIAPITVCWSIEDNHEYEARINTISKKENSMKKNGFFAGLALCLIMFVQPLSALPTEGEFLFEFGSKGTGNGQFDDVNGIAVNACHEIIVTEIGNQRVQVFDRCGNFLFAFGESGTGEGQFQAPYGVVTTQNNDIIVGDFLRNVVLVFDRWGNFLFEFGETGTGEGQFSGVAGIAVNAWGDIIVANTEGLKDIKVFDACGNFLYAFKTPIVDPRRISVDEDGNIYVADVASTLKVFDRFGTFLHEFSEGVFGVAVSESGESVLITYDTSVAMVQVYDRCGNFLFEIDGDFARATDLAVDSDGTIYVLTREVGYVGAKVQVFYGQSSTIGG